MKYNTKKYWVNKEERAGLALAHTKEMEDLYKDEIKDCIDETLVYNANSKRLNNKQIIDFPDYLNLYQASCLSGCHLCHPV